MVFMLTTVDIFLGSIIDLGLELDFLPLYFASTILQNSFLWCHLEVVEASIN